MDTYNTRTPIRGNARERLHAACTLSAWGLLAPWAALNAADHPEGNRGSVSRYLGILATMVEHREDADHHFQQAMAMNERTGARPWLAHTQHDYGQMLLARDTPGDRERARELFAAAQSTYRELGMSRYAAIAEKANTSR